MSFASMANLIVEAVPQHQTGEATGMNTIMRTVGGAFGAQIAAAIITDHFEPGTSFPSESGFEAAFVMGSVARGRGLAAATLIPGRRRVALAETSVSVPGHDLKYRDNKRNLDVAWGGQGLWLPPWPMAGKREKGLITYDNIGQSVTEFIAFVTRSATHQGVLPSSLGKLYLPGGCIYEAMVVGAAAAGGSTESILFTVKGAQYAAMLCNSTDHPSSIGSRL